jgi:hypothetical protein
MVLKNVENRLERLFSKPFSKTFKSGLQPVEIASRILRELDLSRRLTGQGPVSANAIRVWLGPEDAERFDGFQQPLIHELEEAVRQHAVSEGYSFAGPVKVEIFLNDDLSLGEVEIAVRFIGGTAEPKFICSDGRSFPVGGRPLIIGRSPEVDVTINDSNVSRRHAEVWRTPEGVAIRDLGSTNGTIVNGHVIEAVSLSPRDEVSIGNVRFRIEMA